MDDLLGFGGECGSSAAGYDDNTTAVDNSTILTCAARHIQHPVSLPYSATLTIILRVVLGIYFLLLLILGAALNILVIVLVTRHKRLQTYSFGIAMQVVILDLLNRSLIFFSLVSIVANQWVFGEHMCAIVGMVLFCSTTIRTMLMCIFVIDRFLNVFAPYLYPLYKMKVTISLSVAAWVFSVVVSAIPLPGVLDCYTFEPLHWLCVVAGECSYNCFVYIDVSFVLFLTPVTIVPIFLYVALHIKAKRIMKTIPCPAAENHKREWKATVTFFLLFMTVFALNFPAVLIQVTITHIYPVVTEAPPAVFILFTLSTVLISALVVTDPIVIMRNRDVRDIISEIKAKRKC